jgi:predicted enzyme related to lactoylglutathione lyase
MNGFCHIEIPSKDLSKAKGFYEGVFGWKVYGMEGFDNYLLFETGDGIGGGFSPQLALNQTAGILLHILVADIENTLDKIEQHGGQTVLPKTEIPGMGYYAVFSDAEGNQLGIYSEQ